MYVCNLIIADVFLLIIPVYKIEKLCHPVEIIEA